MNLQIQNQFENQRKFDLGSSCDGRLLRKLPLLYAANTANTANPRILTPAGDGGDQGRDPEKQEGRGGEQQRRVLQAGLSLDRCCCSARPIVLA